MTDPKSTTYLEILHAVIARMAGHSFFAKGWSVTLAVAVIGFAVGDDAPRILWVGALGVMMFWVVDAYYLAVERGFRKLFEQEADRRQKADWVERFEMDPETGISETLDAARALAVMMIHLPLLAAMGLTGMLL